MSETATKVVSESNIEDMMHRNFPLQTSRDMESRLDLLREWLADVIKQEVNKEAEAVRIELVFN